MRSIFILGWLLLGLVPVQAVSQSYPDKPVHILVGYSPGGAVDTTARIIAERLGPMLGQPVVVDNRPGVTGNIAARMLSRAAPDGYTLLMATSINAVSVSLFKDLNYHPVSDFAPISKVVLSPAILVVNQAVPANNVQELVAYAKANPGKLAYATSGAGSGPFLAANLLSTMADVEMLHIPYGGGAQAMTDLLSGEIALTFSNPTSVMQHLDSGRIRALAVTTSKRFSVVPNLPTMIEEGYPDFVLDVWYGLVAPKGTPAEIVQRLNGHIADILATPEVQELLLKQGLVAQHSAPESLAKELESDVEMYAKLLKDAGVQPQ